MVIPLFNIYMKSNSLHTYLYQFDNKLKLSSIDNILIKIYNISAKLNYCNPIIYDDRFNNIDRTASKENILEAKRLERLIQQRNMPHDGGIHFN